MTIDIWAIVEDGVVTNTIVATEDFAKEASKDGVAVNINQHCKDGEPAPGIGWRWDGSFFSKPND